MANKVISINKGDNLSLLSYNKDNPLVKDGLNEWLKFESKTPLVDGTYTIFKIETSGNKPMYFYKAIKFYKNFICYKETKKFYCFKGVDGGFIKFAKDNPMVKYI